MVIICPTRQTTAGAVVSVVGGSVATVVGASVVGGSVAIEKIFGWPGIGSLMVTSISSRDYNTILGIAVVICIAVLAANILLDILYSCLDPRITYDE